ncbi:MAG: rod shape-determining protein MreD [Candidatus Nanopelagicaceae bacterium]|jgi:rod shape-determining protein MreD
MTFSRVSLTVSLFFGLFLIQETIVNQVHFLIGGFSLYLAAAMAWISMESRNGAIISGFIAGLILDLSPTIDSPFGQWTLILTIVGYVVSVNREGMGDFDTRPLTLAFIIAGAATLTLVLFLIATSILGESNTTLSASMRELIGNFLWTLLLSPLYVPLMNRIHHVTQSSRDRR